MGITVPSAIVVTATPTSPSCPGDTGTIEASATGRDQLAFTYSIDGTTFQFGTFNGVAMATTR